MEAIGDEAPDVRLERDVVEHGVLDLTKELIFLDLDFLTIILLVLGHETAASNDQFFGVVLAPDNKEISQECVGNVTCDIAHLQLPIETSRHGQAPNVTPTVAGPIMLLLSNMKDLPSIILKHILGNEENSLDLQILEEYQMRSSR